MDCAFIVFRRVLQISFAGFIEPTLIYLYLFSLVLKDICVLLFFAGEVAFHNGIGEFLSVRVFFLLYE